MKFFEKTFRSDERQLKMHIKKKLFYIMVIFIGLGFYPIFSFSASLSGGGILEEGYRDPASESFVRSRKHKAQALYEESMVLQSLYKEALVSKEIPKKELYKSKKLWMLKLREAGNLNHPEANFFLGFIQDEKGNSQKAILYYTLAAMAGHPEAQLNLFVLYRDAPLWHRGDLEKCEEEEHKWLYAAADSCQPEALYEMAWRYERGKGFFPRNIDEAKKYYKLAAERGHKTADAILRCLENGYSGIERLAYLMKILK